MRKCKKCNRMKHLPDFRVDRAGHYGGYYIYCEQCRDALKADGYTRETFLKMAKESPEEEAARRLRESKLPKAMIQKKRAWEARRERERARSKRRRAKEMLGLAKYGITKEDFKRILKAQGGVCMICRVETGRPGKRLCVDHDHATGRVRGLLCNKCNFGLGAFRDSVTVLSRAIEYLSLAGTADQMAAG